MIHPTALIGEPPEARDVRRFGPWHLPSVDISAIVEAYVTVDSGVEGPTRVGPRAWLMKRVHVGHDAIIGDGCELAPGTIVGGYAVLEPGVRCGMGAIIRNRVRVGAGARIGMGAVVTKDVPAGEVWVGNPARRLEKPTATGEVLTESEESGWEELALARGVDPEWVDWFKSR